METQPIHWMAVFSTPTPERPAWLPRDAVLIQLSGGPLAPPAAETGPVSADELNAWPGAAPAAVKIAPPNYPQAIAARRGSVHGPD